MQKNAKIYAYAKIVTVQRDNSNSIRPHSLGLYCHSVMQSYRLQTNYRFVNNFTVIQNIYQKSLFSLRRSNFFKDIVIPAVASFAQNDCYYLIFTARQHSLLC